MLMNSPLVEFPLLAYSGVRSAHYAAQYHLLNAFAGLSPSTQAAETVPITAILNEHIRLLRNDVANIQAGLYPASVLQPESPIDHVLRMPRLVADFVEAYRRRKSNAFQDFDDTAREYLDELPAYYRRNFHFQTNGYLAEQSAELYEHQVELLFGGTADAMRRIVIPPMKEAFGGSDGRGLTFLEIGAGTGRATRFVHLAFPKARIVAIDLSEPYLKVARRNLSDLSRIDFLQGDGARLPFQAGTFDAVYSVFMFHEMPLPVREQVFAESARVVKPGGFVAAVDSCQAGDFPQVEDLLHKFPQNFHEPFFTNYLAHPLQDHLNQPGLGPATAERGFFSKVVWARREA